MKFILFSILFFGLPHILWIPRKLNIAPEEIPLGTGNILIIIAIILWISNNYKTPQFCNPFKNVFLFILIIIGGIGVASVTSFEKDFIVTLTNSKRVLSLLFLYFIPLAIIKNKKDFTIILVICLLVHFLVGLEVFKSGVLGGSAFHDGKRGAGPFGIGWGWVGADVAAGYLSQTVMFCFAFIFGEKIKKWLFILIGICCFTLIVGLFATYARGAMLALILGFMAILITKGIKFKYLLTPIIVLVLIASFLPTSIKTRFDETRTETGELDTGSQVRLVYYATALDIWKEHPIVGVGTSQIRAAMEQRIDKYVDPHNGLLYTACEYGTIGFLIFISMLLTFVRESIKIFRDKTVDPLYRNYALGIIGMVTTLVICNMFYANLYKELILGTLMIHFGMLAFVKASLQQRLPSKGKGGV